ncbi:hypothetical protein BpHYR1_049011 [Brachionus plicatilis]|uniref:Uncharacterized protein n=1 Tax=Brachionus plicatilis TaxID=10195 RepID=A0A3M7QDJ9_BRAPC|nr:hypothetical protein BpHYR1_049011 [Brachionus plicatilis]
MNDSSSGYQQQPVYGNQESVGKISSADSSKASFLSIPKPSESINDYSKLSPELKKKIEEIKYSFLNEKGSSKFSSKDIISGHGSALLPNDRASSFNSPISYQNPVFDDFKNSLSNTNSTVGGFDRSIKNIYEAFVRNKISQENFQDLNKSHAHVHSYNSENPIEYIKNVISSAKNKPIFDSHQISKLPLISQDLGNQEIIFESDYSTVKQIPITRPNYQQPNYGQDQDYKSEKYSIQEQNKSQYKPVETNYPELGENSADFVSQEKDAFKNNELNDIMNDESGYQTPQVHEYKGAYENEASNDVIYDGQKGYVESSPVQGYQPILSDKNANYQLDVDSTKLSVQETDKFLKFLLPKITSTQMGHQQFFKIDIPIDKNSQAYCKDSPNGVTIGLRESILVLVLKFYFTFPYSLKKS